MKARKILVLVADGQRARLLERTMPGRKLAPVGDRQFIHPTLPARDLVSDRPGRSFDSSTPGRHAVEPKADVVREEKRKFAREIVGEVAKAWQSQGFDDLLLVAPPQFLGELRQVLPAELAGHVKAEIGKDLTREPPQRLAVHLEDQL